MNSHVLALALGSLLAGGPALVPAPQTPAAPEQTAPVTLRFALKEGESHRLRRVSTRTSGDDAIGPETTVTVLTETIKKVAPDGAFAREIRSENPPVVSTITHDRTGRIVDFTINGSPASSTDRLFTRPDYQYLPDRPVKVSDTWTLEVENPAVKDDKVTQTYTYLGTEKVLGIDTHKIKMTMSLRQPVKVEAETIRFRDAETGLTVKVVSVVNGIPSLNGPAQWGVEAVRIVPGVNDKEDPKENRSK